MKKKKIQTFPEPPKQINQEECQKKLIKSLATLVDCNVISEKDNDEKEFHRVSDVVEVLSKLTDIIEQSPEVKSAIKSKTYKDFLNLFKN